MAIQKGATRKPVRRLVADIEWDGKALSARVTTWEVDAHRDESIEKLLPLFKQQTREFWRRRLWLHGRIVGPLVSAKRSTNL